MRKEESLTENQEHWQLYACSKDRDYITTDFKIETGTFKFKAKGQKQEEAPEFLFNNGKFEGIINGDKKNHYLPNGWIFKKNTLVLPDGSQYKGPFENGVPKSGKDEKDNDITLTLKKNETTYQVICTGIGEVDKITTADGNPLTHDSFSFTFPNGIQFTGKVTDGKIVRGTKTYLHGRKEKVETQNGELIITERTQPNGQIEKGRFEKGKLLNGTISFTEDSPYHDTVVKIDPKNAIKIISHKGKQKTNVKLPDGKTLELFKENRYPSFTLTKGTDKIEGLINADGTLDPKICKFDDGSEFKGEFTDNLTIKSGRLYKTDRRIEVGKFRNGQLIEGYLQIPTNESNKPVKLTYKRLGNTVFLKEGESEMNGLTWQMICQDEFLKQRFIKPSHPISLYLYQALKATPLKIGDKSYPHFPLSMIDNVEVKGEPFTLKKGKTPIEKELIEQFCLRMEAYTTALKEKSDSSSDNTNKIEQFRQCLDSFTRMQTDRNNKVITKINPEYARPLFELLKELDHSSINQDLTDLLKKVKKHLHLTYKEALKVDNTDTDNEVYHDYAKWADNNDISNARPEEVYLHLKFAHDYLNEKQADSVLNNEHILKKLIAVQALMKDQDLKGDKSLHELRQKIEEKLSSKYPSRRAKKTGLKNQTDVRELTAELTAEKIRKNEYLRQGPILETLWTNLTSNPKLFGTIEEKVKTAVDSLKSTRDAKTNPEEIAKTLVKDLYQELSKNDFYGNVFQNIQTVLQDESEISRAINCILRRVCLDTIRSNYKFLTESAYNIAIVNPQALDPYFDPYATQLSKYIELALHEHFGISFAELKGKIDIKKINYFLQKNRQKRTRGA